ncbi:hypothetical protein ACMT4L_02290 [Deinococcus sp. A31D244]|uniref:hypothetical protein n=1 Tax=Deinococcus sp. A31D244 TaxID=3397675 RepID=UPI0039E1B9DA
MRAPAVRPALILSAALLGSASTHALAACDPAGFMPPGTRTYRLTTQGQSSTFTSRAQVKGNAVTVQTTMGSQTTTSTWTCTGKGMTANIGAGKGDLRLDSGFYPPTSAWKVGYAWTSDGKLQASGGMNMQSRSRSRIAAQEKVTTPAGTFTALRVETTTTTTMTPPAGADLPPGMDLNKLMGGETTSTAWYVRGVGLVKQTIPSAQHSMVLTKYTR